MRTPENPLSTENSPIELIKEKANQLAQKYKEKIKNLPIDQKHITKFSHPEEVFEAYKTREESESADVKHVLRKIEVYTARMGAGKALTLRFSSLEEGTEPRNGPEIERIIVADGNIKHVFDNLQDVPGFKRNAELSEDEKKAGYLLKEKVYDSNEEGEFSGLEILTKVNEHTMQNEQATGSFLEPIKKERYLALMSEEMGKILPE